MRQQPCLTGQGLRRRRKVAEAPRQTGCRLHLFEGDAQSRRRTARCLKSGAAGIQQILVPPGDILARGEAATLREGSVDVVEEGADRRPCPAQGLEIRVGEPAIGREELRRVLEPGLSGAVATHASREVGEGANNHEDRQSGHAVGHHRRALYSGEDQKAGDAGT